MKKFLKYILIPVFVAATVINCTDHFDELNTDPTTAGPEQFDPNFLLTTTQLRYTGSADFSYETWRAQLIHFSTMMQHFSHVAGYWVGDKYTLNQAYNSAYFERAYDEQVKQVVDLVELTRGKAEYANLHQIGRIMKVLVFHRLTDIYGDVPYFDAGMGYYKRIFTPEYDAQQDIYTDMLKELEEAVAALDETKDKPHGDLFYFTSLTDNTQITKWKKFGNSLMLRLAMRLTKADNGKAKQYAEKAAAGPLIANISENAIVKHDEAAGRPTVNRISQVLTLPYELPVIKWSKTFIDMMQSTNDPRLAFLSQLPNGDTDPGDQRGMPNGYDLQGGATDITTAPGYPGAVGADKVGNYSMPRTAILAKMAGPTFILTLAEVELLLAEANKNGWNIPGETVDHYNAGVTAAMQQLSQFDAAATISGPAITAYLVANPYVDLNGYEMIGEQYWLATILNEYETFANWRRTGFPVLTPVNYPGNVTGGTIPRRLLYPLAEASTNSANYQDALARIGGIDVMTARVWWDKP